MAQIFSDTDNMYGGTSGALQTDFPTSVNDVFSNPPKAAMVMEGDFVPGAATTKLKPITGYNQFAFPSVDGSPPSVVGGGDTVVMFKDTPAARALVTIPRDARGGDDLGQAGRLLLAQQGRAGIRLSRSAQPRDGDGARAGEDLPLRHVRSRSRRRSAAPPARASGRSCRTSSRTPRTSPAPPRSSRRPPRRRTRSRERGASTSPRSPRSRGSARSRRPGGAGARPRRGRVPRARARSCSASGSCYPVVATIERSFFDRSGSNFVGFDNYQRCSRRPRSGRRSRTTRSGCAVVPAP